MFRQIYLLTKANDIHVVSIILQFGINLKSDNKADKQNKSKLDKSIFYKKIHQLFGRKTIELFPTLETNHTNKSEDKGL